MSTSYAVLQTIYMYTDALERVMDSICLYEIQANIRYLVNASYFPKAVESV